MPNNTYSSQDTGASLGDILTAALDASKAEKPKKDNSHLLFNIIQGDPNQPKDTWHIYTRGVTLDEAKKFCKIQNDYAKEQSAHYMPGGRYHPDSNPNSETSYFEYDYVRRYNQTIRDYGSIEAYLVGCGYNLRYAMVRVPVEQDYHAREAARTDNPTYLTETLWVKTDYPYFYATIGEGNMVSFYRTTTDAYDNKRTEMRLGKFLREFNPYLDETEISTECAKMGVKYDTSTYLKVARTREEIKNVYIHGPRSCMSGEQYPFDKIHPVEAYASDDLCVYYIERDGEIIARTVANTLNHRHSTIYGDETRMLGFLEPLGYKYSDAALGGARLLKILSQCKRYILTPYIDGRCQELVDRDDGHLFIKPADRVYTGSTGGYARYYE